MLDQIKTVKSGLAKVLATENIIVRHERGLSTASFEPKRRILRLPVWEKISNNLYDMLIVHEVGHALYTPIDITKYLDKFANKVVKSKDKTLRERAKNSFFPFLNVLEDIRIDSRQKSRFPGSKRDYLIGYKELYDSGFFGTKKMPIEAMTFLDRLNIHSKAGFSGAHVPFTMEERAVVAKAFKLCDHKASFDDVFKLAMEIWQDQKDKMNPDQCKSDQAEESESKQKSKSGKDEEESEDENEDSEDSKSEKKDKDKDEQKSNKDKKKGKDEDESEEESDEGETESDSDEEENEGSSDDDSDAEEEDDSDGDDKETSEAGQLGDDSVNENTKLPESTTDKQLAKGIESLAESHGNEIVYCELPAIVPIPYVPYKEWLAKHRAASANFPHVFIDTKKSLDTFRTKENETISFMIKEFEARKSADAYSKIQIAKTGVINTNKLHSYKFSEDIFKRNTIVPVGKNHGFVMFIDWSSSMSNNIGNTLRQLYSLVWFCKRAQIPFEVYSFTSGTHNPFMSSMDTNMSFGDHQVRIHQFLTSGMNAQEFSEALLYMWTVCNGYYNGPDGMNGTPLYETMYAANQIVRDFQKKYKIQITNIIVLSDGAGAMPRFGESIGRYGGSQYGADFIIQDNVTKDSYSFKNMTTQDITKMFCDVLKKRTGANLIGMYLISGDWKTTASYKSGKPVTQAQIQSWQNNKFCRIEDYGYDDYYLIHTNNLKMDERSFEEYSDQQLNKQGDNYKITTARLTKLLEKFSEKTSNSRVLLTDFIKRIA